MSRAVTVGTAVLLLAGLAGCGTARASGEIVMCHHQEVPLRGLRDGRPATELGPDGRAALKGTEVRRIDDLAGWTIVEESDTRVALIRELDTPHSESQGMVFTHEFLDIERFGERDGNGRPGWHMRASSRCDLRRDLGDAGTADVALDPAAPPPGRDSRQVAVLVHERDCADGRRADGRVRLIDIESTSTEVRIVIGVQPLSGILTCQGNPPTPFTVELDEPLGDRVLIDASVYPPRRIVEGAGWTSRSARRRRSGGGGR
ncbi:hypothetical protein [Streptosporangium sp. NPDC087985]|uniref:hypothetical protein n=1 Tax=Streptosporangium sp. NPDC087985 TaxID=3366196 RepID=UPI003821F0AB